VVRLVTGALVVAARAHPFVLAVLAMLASFTEFVMVWSIIMGRLNRGERRDLERL
jgi:hypothetical protein